MLIASTLVFYKVHILLTGQIHFDILFVHWYCTRRWYIDKLGGFHTNQTSMCLDPHYNLGEVGAVFKALIIFLLTVPRRQFFVDLFVIFLCHTAMFVSCSLDDTCWKRADV